MRSEFSQASCVVSPKSLEVSQVMSYRSIKSHNINIHIVADH